jgi:hypothetical protein
VAENSRRAAEGILAAGNTGRGCRKNVVAWKDEVAAEVGGSVQTLGGGGAHHGGLLLVGRRVSEL